MVVKEKSDTFKLLCTALVLALLRIKFAHNEGVWGEIIKKSEEERVHKIVNSLVTAKLGLGRALLKFAVPARRGTHRV